ncbi:hypothetical protein, partial [Bifidobacterium adolescentis]|uniref:hypothetical protein n=1 Tax=Bifidobacterium adolescentis TaxID=1680 RepID=UPI0040634C2E
QFAQFLPDPIGYTRHLARSHTTIVATQQLQYKSKSQPWSNRAKHIISMTCTGLDFLTEKAVTSGLWTIGTYWKSMRRITL